MKIVLIFLLCFSLAGCAGLGAKEDFCGRSTQGVCYKDSDCKVGGCFEQLCRSRFDTTLHVVCDGRDCYNAKAYGFNCKCIDNKCQWKK